jgi:hypothetical protein
MKKKSRIRRNNNQTPQPGKSGGILFSNRLSRFLFLIPLILLPLLTLLFLFFFPLQFTEFRPKSMSEYLESMKTKPGKGKAQFTDFSSEEEKALFFNLKIDELFWKNRLEIAKDDSMYLSIDLPDSLVLLELKGIPLRSCKIEEFQITPLYSQLRKQPQFLEWLTDPFSLIDESATISKAPIKEIIAPKDTIEALEQLKEEVKIDKEDVRFVLGFDRNLLLEFSQAEKPTLMGRFELALFNILKNITTFFKDFFSLMSLQSSSQDFWIKIRISQNDAKAIYRALPKNTRVALRF